MGRWVEVKGDKENIFGFVYLFMLNIEFKLINNCFVIFGKW